jgi:hypothetical protein
MKIAVIAQQTAVRRAKIGPISILVGLSLHTTQALNGNTQMNWGKLSRIVSYTEIGFLAFQLVVLSPAHIPN